MKIVVGLGNPGNEYVLTRHNIGFRVLDALAAREDASFSHEKKFNADVARAGEMVLVKPMTFMNNSGTTVRAITDYFGVDTTDVVCVYDDKDIPFGEVRVRDTGSSGGHNGVQSLIQHLGTPDFGRVRIGVHTELCDRMDTADFVLQRFSAEEEAEIDGIIDQSIEHLR